MTGGLVIHFVLVLLYSTTFVSYKKKLDYYSVWYSYPYFHQTWNLFAPVPDVNYKLIAEYENDGIKKEDIFNKLVHLHQSNRLSGYGPLVLAFANSIYYFEKNRFKNDKLNGPIRNDLYFDIIKKCALHYLSHSCKKQISKIKLTLVIQNTQSNEQKVYFN